MSKPIYLFSFVVSQFFVTLFNVSTLAPLLVPLLVGKSLVVADGATTSTTAIANGNAEHDITDIFDQRHDDKNGTKIIIEGDIRATWESISLLYSPEYARSIGLVPPPPPAPLPDEQNQEERDSAADASNPKRGKGKKIKKNRNDHHDHQKGTLSPDWSNYYWYNDWRPNAEIWRVDVFMAPGVFTAAETKTIKRALRHFYRETGVVKANFVKTRPTSTQYIEFVKDGGCWSYVGKIPDWIGQALSLDKGCVYRGTIQHEFLHALGFYHEQSRPDRDDYVTINLENVREGYEYNFAKVSYIDSLGSPYDYKSVMHYGEYSFSANGEKTLDTRGNDLGAGNRVSIKDINQVSSFEPAIRCVD
jgi:hypothetical protein